MYARGGLVTEERLYLVLRQWLIVVVMCGLTFGLERVGWLYWLRGGLERGLFAIDQNVSMAITVLKRPLIWWRVAQERTTRVASLENRLEQAAVDQVRLKELEGQVTTLQALTLKTQAGDRANQVTRLVDFGDQVMVAAGARDAVYAGQIVTDKQKVVLGRISRVGRLMSEVKLLSDSGCRVPVQTLSGASKGIIEGNGNGAELTGVLQAEPLAVGDLVVTTGQGGDFPPGLIVGQVMSLTGKPEDVTKGAVIALLAERNGWVVLW